MMAFGRLGRTVQVQGRTQLSIIFKVEGPCLYVMLREISCVGHAVVELHLLLRSDEVMAFVFSNLWCYVCGDG